MNLNRLTYYLLTAFAALLLCACSAGDDFEGQFTPSDGSGFCLRLYLDASGAPASRAPEGDDYQAGVDYENFIDIDGGDFRVALFATDDSWLATVHPSDITLGPVTAGAVDSKRYSLEIKLDISVAERINDAEGLKVVVLANWRHNYPGIGAGMTLDRLFEKAEEIAYTSLPVGTLTAENKIPMFGVTQFTGVHLLPDVASLLGSIHLLRALAKVEIRDAEFTKFPITSARLTRHTTGAAPMPRGVTHQDHYVKGNYAGDYVKYPSFPAAWGSEPRISDTPVDLEFVPESDAWVVYIPEFDNTSASAVPARLELNFEGLENSDFIDFKYYSDAPAGSEDGDPFDVLRNNIYRFTVTKGAHGDLSAVVDILPYNSIELNPDFGLERDPINGWLCFRNEVGYLICYYDEETDTFYDTDYQKITFSTSSEHPSWIEVTDAHDRFAWYFDAESGRMYDVNGQELAGLRRHQTTGWLIRTIPGTDLIDYYLDPLSICIYDRNRNEVELETPEDTGDYKYLRDDDGHILVRFDAISGKIYDSDNQEVSLQKDSNGRFILQCPSDGSIFCKYDITNASFYNADGAKIKNPFTNPGWQPYRYNNGSLICYYDVTSGKFLDQDLDTITFVPHDTQPWLRVVDHEDNFVWWFDYETGRLYDESGKMMNNVERDRTSGNVVRRDSRGEIAYYLNPLALVVYDLDQKIIRLTHESIETNALKVLSYEAAEGSGPAHYYFDAATGKLYDKNHTEIPFGSLPRDSKGRIRINNDAGALFRYYDVAKGRFYTSIEIQVTNPFIEHTFDVIITDDGKFVCFYYQDEHRFTDGYGRRLTWQLITSTSHNPWFEVVDESNNFFWNVDLFTFKLYDKDGVEITSPEVTNTIINKKVTSGKIDARTGRVEYIYDNHNEWAGTQNITAYATQAYWLDPLSLVVYDRDMCEVVLPHQSDSTKSKQILRAYNKTDGQVRTCYFFDVLNRQIYKYKNRDKLEQGLETTRMYGAVDSSKGFYFRFRWSEGSDGYPYYYTIRSGKFYNSSTFIDYAPNVSNYTECTKPPIPFLDQL